jgi:hypothetical protein
MCSLERSIILLSIRDARSPYQVITKRRPPAHQTFGGPIVVASRDSWSDSSKSFCTRTLTITRALPKDAATQEHLHSAAFGLPPIIKFDS